MTENLKEFLVYKSNKRFDFDDFRRKQIKESDLPSKAKELFKALMLKQKTRYGYSTIDLYDGEDKFLSIKALFENINWNDSDNFKLLEFLFGNTYAKFMPEAWDSLGEVAYQQGFSRRSFRAPNEKDILLKNKIQWLIDAQRVWFNREEDFYLLLPPKQALRLGNEIVNFSFTLPIAKMIDSGDTELFEVAQNIIFGKENETGKVSNFLIKVLLASKKQECWELVAKLLLSAQRQEGLRQTIMESADTPSSKGAIKFIIDLILKEKLTRFSSVVRAVDVWFGFGFEAEKESTIKKILTSVSEFLEDEQKAHDTLRDFSSQSDNVILYSALWSLSLTDVAQTLPYLELMISKGNVEKQCLAIYFVKEVNILRFKNIIYAQALENPSLQTLSFLLDDIVSSLKNYSSEQNRNDELFERVFTLAESIKEKEKPFEGLVFSWTKSIFKKDTLLNYAYLLAGDNTKNRDRMLLMFDSFSLNLRDDIARNIFGEFYFWGYYALKEKIKDAKGLKVSDFQKEFAFKIISDRAESLQSTAFNVLYHLKLSKQEFLNLTELYNRKGQAYRKVLSEFVLTQQEDTIKDFISELLDSKSQDQRSGGLDLLSGLQQKGKLKDFISLKVSDFRSRAKLSKAEETLLDRILPSEDDNKSILSEENGYGVFDPKNITPWQLPSVDENGFYAQRVGYKSNKGILGSIKDAVFGSAEQYGFSKPFSEIKKDLDNLVKLIQKHKDYEYEIQRYDNSKEVVLLGNTFTSKIYHTEGVEPRQIFESYPLYEVWEQWFKDTGLDACDLFLLTTFENESDIKKISNFLSKYVFYYDGKLPKIARYDWNDPVQNCLNALMYAYPFGQKNDFVIDLLCNIFQNIPKEITEVNYREEGYYYSRDDGSGWQNYWSFSSIIELIDTQSLNDENLKRLWNIYRFMQFTGLKENISLNKPILEVAAPCYAMGYITKDELTDCLLSKDYLRNATNDNLNKNHYQRSLFEKYDFIKTIAADIQEAFLPVEIVRGDLNTPVTKFVAQFETIYGAKYAIEMLANLGKKSFNRGYIWYSDSMEITKQKLFSLLIKKTYPSKEDTQEHFESLVKQQGKNLTNERLIEFAMYAPQWHKFVSEYLGWKGLDSGIWWMHAHTKTSEYQARSSEFESEVARYSTLDLEDFKIGAVDKVWFESAYSLLGAQKWEILYDSAKYISEGNGHRRAKICSDTLTGVYTLTDIWQKVEDKRDQEFLRVYGLIPLDKKNTQKDLLSRYEKLVKFKKESRQFGQMKQASEAIAYQVAMDNLARNAGYSDPQRLIWAMETAQVQEIFSKATDIEIDEYHFSLLIDEQGKADIEILKDSKPLKAVPASLKKNEQVVQLTENRKTLREQLSRAKKGLEQAMISQDKFSYSELTVLFNHPVISKLLEKLVLITSSGKIGFYNQGKLTDFKGVSYDIDKDETICIAHSYDLHKEGVWVAYQTYAFDRKLVQPFKQIFRELYIPTPDELKEVSISRRYAGHQVQPKQTLALLKSRGWKVDYEEGLQKVYHKQGFQVKLYAMADWFSPSDVEAPTLETIEFHSLKDYTNIAFEDINPLIFSEVMRDIDLVVSVAYVGGVDPEASQSTIEMRIAILTQTLRLFKLKNVTISKNHALIQGEMAQYSVHLGSGVVHQVGQGYMSILPVHSQHRGRLFLPFIDDDPKTAEVMSKILLLSKDKDIKDPTILRQIKETKAQ